MSAPMYEETPIICPKCGKVLGKHVLNFDTAKERGAKHAAFASAIKFHQAQECDRA